MPCGPGFDSRRLHPVRRKHGTCRCRFSFPGAWSTGLRGSSLREFHFGSIPGASALFEENTALLVASLTHEDRTVQRVLSALMFLFGCRSEPSGAASPSDTSATAKTTATAPTPSADCSGCERYSRYQEPADCYRFEKGAAPSAFLDASPPRPVGTSTPVEVSSQCEPSCCGLSPPDCSGCRNSGGACLRFGPGETYESGWCAPRCCGSLR